jgi:hypothetical protein
VFGSVPPYPEQYSDVTQSLSSYSQANLDDVLYLVHVTGTNPMEWSDKKLKAAEFLMSPDYPYVDQFPGVFLSIVTKQNELNTSSFPGGNYKLYFSKNLLKQNNFHINLGDFQGFIGQNMTYYPWQLSTALESIKRFAEEKTDEDREFKERYKILGETSVELVFHDDILFDSLFKIENIDKNGDQTFEVETIYSNPSALSDFKPDLTKIPFFVFPFEKYYGSAELYEGKIPASDLSFFRAMGRLANLVINDTDTIDSIVDQLINGGSETMYNNRSLQNLDTFIGSYHSSLLRV